MKAFDIIVSLRSCDGQAALRAQMEPGDLQEPGERINSAKGVQDNILSRGAARRVAVNIVKSPVKNTAMTHTEDQGPAGRPRFLPVL